MKTNTMKSILVAGLALMGAFAMAQGGGGQGRGMMGMMGGGGGMTGLLQAPDVQKDLKLTDKQKADLQAQQTKVREQMQSMMQGGGRPDPAQMQEMMKKINDDTMAILDANQKVRLKQIFVQTNPGGALQMDEIQKELGLKAAQKQAIEGLVQKQREANMAIMQQQRNQEISGEDAQAARQKNNDIFNAEVVKVLDGDQQKAFEAMKGPKFEGSIRAPRGGGQGGGQGAGRGRTGGATGGGTGGGF